MEKTLFYGTGSKKSLRLTIFSTFVSLVSWQIWHAFILFPNYSSMPKFYCVIVHINN
jgi:hypothetical protein